MSRDAVRGRSRLGRLCPCGWVTPLEVFPITYHRTVYRDPMVGVGGTYGLHGDLPMFGEVLSTLDARAWCSGKCGSRPCPTISYRAFPLES
jgi:hypothetical protein